MQNINGLAEITPIDEVVPIGDDVIDRATVAAEGDTAVHATGTLNLGVGIGKARHELTVVLDARVDLFVGVRNALELDKSGWLAHLCHLFLHVLITRLA